MDHLLTIAHVAEQIRARETTSVEVTESVLARIQRFDSTLGAFVTLNADEARAMASCADEDFAAGIDRGPLQGIPVALKDIISTQDAPTTAGSAVLERDWGDGRDSVVAERLRAAGAVLMGKLSTWEFATGQPAPESNFPIPLNPWDLKRSPGGSSSGTGVAVAAGFVFGGLGTDTGGSIRNPSAKNNLTGLKGTFGLVPKWGCVPAGYSLDVIGPMARSAFDCALILNVIAGYDSRDVQSSQVSVEDDYCAAIDAGVRGLRIGIPREHFYDHSDNEPEVNSATLGVIEVLRGLGAEVVDVTLPMAAEAATANSVTGACDAFAYHRVDLGRRWHDYGPQTRMKIVRGALYTGADYVQAQRFRTWFCREAAKVMANVDVLIAPVTREVSLPKASADKGAYSDTSIRAPFSLLGYPVLAVPSGFASNGMPLSSQIVGAPFAEAVVLRVGHALQQVTDWHTRVAPVVEGAEGL